MEKVKNIFYKTVLTILIIFVGYVTYCSVFKIYQPKETLNPMVIILATILMILVFTQLKRILKKVPQKYSNYIALGLSIIFFVGMSVFGNLVTSIPTFDLSNVIREANIMVQNGGKFATEEYFSVYSNQVPLTILIYYIFKIGSLFNIQNLKGFAIVINSLFVAITSFFTYLSVKKLKGYKEGLISLIFFIINPIFYLTASYFYSDTLCMPFAAIAFYIFIITKNETSLKKKIFLEAIAGVLLAIGFKIRVVLGILLIAVLMVKVISSEQRKKYSIITIILSFVLGLGICAFLEKIHEPIINKDLKYPSTHWLMMGTNYKTDGRYNAEDFLFTKNSGTYSQKQESTIKKAKERIFEIGPIGIIPFMAKKLDVNWSNGSYDYFIKLMNSEKVNGLYEYVVGNKRIFITYFYQICKTTILFLLFMAIINEIKNKDGINSKYSNLYIAIFGAFLFYLIWEVLTRYSLTFLPWLIILFSIGIEETNTLSNIIFKKIKIPVNITKRVLSILTIVITAILFIINYDKYAVKKNDYIDKRVMQISSEQGDLIPKIANNNIKQTFKTGKSFNNIAIMMTKENTKNITNYIFKLKDSNGKELVEQKFTSEQVKNNKLKSFDFKRIKPIGVQQYIIEIYSNDATQDNSIGIATFYQDKYDAYPNGNIILNGEEKQADFTFQVQNKVKRTYVNKKIYIFVSITVIFIEIFAFYPYLFYNSKRKNEI